MAERYFDNEMPNFTPENAAVAASEQDSLAKLLSLPYNTLADKFKTAALHLKQLVLLIYCSIVSYFFCSADQLFDI